MSDRLRWIEESFPDEALNLAVGFQDAIVGVQDHCPGRPALVVYDTLLCIEILMRDGMTEDDAGDYFTFNVSGSWVGVNTPIFMTPYEGER